MKTARLFATLAFLFSANVLAQPAADGGVRLQLDAPVLKAETAMEQWGHELRSELPPEWRKPSVLTLERWQWVAIPSITLLVIGLTLLFARLTRRLVTRFSRLKDSGDDAGRRGLAASFAYVLEQLEPPLRLWWSSLLARLTLPLLALAPATEAGWERLFRVSFLLAIFWGAWRAVAAWTTHFGTTSYALSHPGTRSLVTLVARVLRFALIAFGVLAALSEIGYSVTSVLAGLGIGGIALALGAQKTLENVFGAFALAVDQPIREGDLIRVGELIGQVESIGLRSTRIRTTERTVVSIPNGKLADLHLETFAARDRIRFVQKLSLSLDTPKDTLLALTDACRKVLNGQARLHPGSSTVSVVALGPGSIDVEAAAWFATTDLDEYRDVREQVLLELLAAVEKSGAQLAVPLTDVRVLTAPAAK